MRPLPAYRASLVAMLLLTAACGCTTLRPVHVLGNERRGWDAAFSPDSSVVAAAAADGPVRVWSTSSGQELAQCDDHAITIRTFNSPSLAFSPDGAHLAFAASDRSVRVWDWRSGDVIATLSGHPSPPTRARLTLDARVVSVSGGLTYDPAPSAVRRPVTRPATTNSIADRPRSSREPMTVITWDLTTGRELSRWQNDAAGVLLAVLSPDARFVATIGIPGIPRRLEDLPRDAKPRREIAVWDARTGAVVRRWPDEGKYMPVHLALSHDGRLLLSSGLTGGSSAPGVLRDVATGTERKVPIGQATFSPDDRQLLAIAGITKNVGPAFPLFGLLYLPPEPPPKIRVDRVDVRTGKLLTSRELRTRRRTVPLAWPSDLSMFIDVQLRLWKLPG